MAGVRSPIAGTPICGDGTLCGTWSVYELADPPLHLLGRTYSPNIIGGDSVVITSRPRLHLAGRTYAVVITQTLAFGAAELRLVGKTYLTYRSVGPTFDSGAILRLRGKTLTLGIGQTIPFGKPSLTLRARGRLRVGQPGLIPSAPEVVILTPSPVVLSDLLVPTVGGGALVGEFLVGEERVGPVALTGLLTPSPVRAV